MGERDREREREREIEESGIKDKKGLTRRGMTGSSHTC